MKLLLPAVACFLAAFIPVSNAWSIPVGSRIPAVLKTGSRARLTTRLPVSSASSPPKTSGETDAQVQLREKKEERKEIIRKEGGLFAFNTKYGALNPYGIYYGLTSIFLGLFWYVALTATQFLYFITRSRVDRLRRIPVFFSQIWGTTLLRLTRNMPEVENPEILTDFYKKHRAAMFVANHNSWLDIPFVGTTIGWRNYKLVSKAELGKVPILGRAIKVGGNVMVDRGNRRSQLKTLKTGMQILKDGVHLCTFPEGTRARSGRLQPFKNGAFKMAYKAGAPVIPLSIVASAKTMPHYWMFPFRPAHGIAKVVVHEPIESEGKTEKELAEAVRQSIISGLPEDQRPE